MDLAESLNYVRAAGCAAGIPLDDARAKSVAEHLLRTSLMARALEQADLSTADELAEIYQPAPFPALAEPGVLP